MSKAEGFYRFIASVVLGNQSFPIFTRSSFAQHTALRSETDTLDDA